MRLIHAAPIILLALSTPGFLPAVEPEDAAADAPADASDAVADWSTPVPGWTPVAADEHPRLIFRAADLPRLRERAALPDGVVIMQRLDALLAGPLTTWTPAGWALRHRITGDPQAAQQFRETLTAVLGGAKNPDARYNFTKPNGQLRAGPVLAGVALAYDLGYDLLDADGRAAAVRGILQHPMLQEIITQPAHGPGCNHYGAHQGGAGVALLALAGDAGVDQAQITSGLEKLLPRIRKELTYGFSERGYYTEGHQCGRISATGIVPFLIAYRTAAGRDLITGRSHAANIHFGWTWDMVRSPKGPAHPQRGMYARNVPRGTQRSETNDFAALFGILPEERIPMWHWLYNEVVAPKAEQRDYDVMLYPDTAAYALAFWPMGATPRNPGETLPKVFHDPGVDYLAFRSGWSDGGRDLVVTTLMGRRPTWGRCMSMGGSILIAGHGLSTGKDPWFTFPGMFHHSRLTHHRFAADGSASISGSFTGGWVHPKRKNVTTLGATPTALAVDYSRASGADLVVAMVGPMVGFTTGTWIDIVPMKQPPKRQELPGGRAAVTVMGTVGGSPAAVFTLGKDVPAAVLGKDTITVGGQTFTWDATTLMPRVMGPEVAAY
jgi:hypothetical protein